MYLETEFLNTAPCVRRPIQCEGIARGPERATDVAVSGSVTPQFWGALASLIPVAANAISGLLD